MPVDRGDYRELGSTRNNSGVENPSEVKRDLIFFKGIMSDMAVRVDRLEKRGLLGQQQFKSMYVGSANIRNLYVPNSTSTPRVQITRNTHGGFAILGSGDTYSDVTGSGTYQVLFDYAKSPVGLYFANGAAYIGSDGITLNGGSDLNINNTTTAATPKVVKLNMDWAPTGPGTGIGFYALFDATTNASAQVGYQSSVRATVAGQTTTRVDGFNAFLSASEGTITTANGFRAQLHRAAAGVVGSYRGLYAEDGGPGVATTSYGVLVAFTQAHTTAIGVSVGVSGATNNRGVEITAPSSGANNYAIYSSAAAQSVHAGNFRIGSTTAPTVALNVSGEASIDPSIAGNATVGINNISANTAAGMAVSMSVPATSTTGDVRFSQSIAATKTFSFGIDNSDSDAWVLSENASLGTSNRIRALGSDVQLLTTAKATANGWYIKGGTAAYGADTAGVLLDLALDTASTTLAVNIIHSAASGTANTELQLGTHSSSTGDPQVHFRISGTQSWRIGIDNSASDAFVISRGTGLGTNNVISISTADAITLSEGVNLVLGTTTGTKIGTATTQKLGFFNATPIVRGTAFTQTFATATHTHNTDGSANFPAGGVGTAAGGWDTAANRDLAITRFNALRTTVDNIKQVVNGLIDDLQALGLIG